MGSKVKQVTLNVRLAESLREAVKKRARREDRSLSAVVRLLAKAYAEGKVSP